MTRSFLGLWLLSFAALACSLTAQPAANSDLATKTPYQEPGPTAGQAEILAAAITTSSPTPEQGRTCKVRTGGQWLNMRSGPGLASSVLAVLAEGDQLTLTNPSQDSWQPVKTATGQAGWVKINFLNCED